MSDFKTGDRVRLKLAAARKLQSTYGVNNHFFQNLVGLIGHLEAPPNEHVDFMFVAIRRRFGIHIHEIEHVDVLCKE